MKPVVVLGQLHNLNVGLLGGDQVCGANFFEGEREMGGGRGEGEGGEKAGGGGREMGVGREAEGGEGKSCDELSVLPTSMHPP